MRGCTITYTKNMGTIMMNEEFHKPFLKSMVIIAFTTLIAMITSKYVVEYYMGLETRDVIHTSFETTESQISVEHPQ